jgi:hypothetical protein
VLVVVRVVAVVLRVYGGDGRSGESGGGSGESVWWWSLVKQYEGQIIDDFHFRYLNHEGVVVADGFRQRSCVQLCDLAHVL